MALEKFQGCRCGGVSASLRFSVAVEKLQGGNCRCVRVSASPRFNEISAWQLRNFNVAVENFSVADAAVGGF